MDRFIIEGGHRLSGSIRPAGNKNAALPLLAATLLSAEPVILRNMPEIGDVVTKRALLGGLGVHITSAGDHAWQFHTPALNAQEPEAQLARRIRTSILLAGPLLARRGHVRLPRPGGDAIGRRRLDTHFQALRALGTQVEITPTEYVLTTHGLHGSDIFLDEMSVTGTEQAILAAVCARGTTTIANAASEPHIQDLCNCLNAMGGKISGIGTNFLTIEGVATLHGADFEIGPDYMEVGSFIGLAAVTGSELRITGARPREHRMTKIAFGRLGVHWRDDGEDIVVPGNQELRVLEDAHNAIPKIESMPWPGFPADLLSIAIVVATQSTGTVLIHEKLFESRLFFVDRLISMGAKIVLCDPHRAVVVGASRLFGEPDGMPSPDIRAGMALLIASLCARGKSVIHNIAQIDRGYEAIEQRLQTLGARIERARG
ncbi:MAG: hypothetical protein RL076_141 [Chloroflexota bacterium]